MKRCCDCYEATEVRPVWNCWGEVVAYMCDNCAEMRHERDQEAYYA